MKIRKIVLLSAAAIAVAACLSPVVSQPGYPPALVQYPVTGGECAVWVENMQARLTSGACGSGGGTPGNPTATIGASAVNGVATTYMRSDGAPALPATLPALNGSLLTALNATQLTSGTVPDARFPATLPAASGVNLTALNASNLSSGTIPNARISALPNANLQNSAITLCGTATSLGGTLTASACLDNLGATQGQILYRNASAWVPLAPGTAGQLLQSGGAGANPSWTTASGTGTMTEITAGPGIAFDSGATCDTTCTISLTVSAAEEATSYGLAASDAGGLRYANSGSAVAWTIPVASTSGYTEGAGWEMANLGAGALTLTATTSVFGNGLTTLVLNKGQYAFFASDSTNYPITAVTLPVMANNTLLGNSSGTANYPTAQTIGANVLTALGNALSAAGGVTTTVVSGTSALGTSAIASGACATAVTTSATGAATTDVILAGFNGDPTGVTGYAPDTDGMLTIISYPSANNVNFKVCNNTLASITPGAITLNWRIVR